MNSHVLGQALTAFESAFQNHTNVKINCEDDPYRDAYVVTLECRECASVQLVTLSKMGLAYLKRDRVGDVLRYVEDACRSFDRWGCAGSPDNLAQIAEWLTVLLAQKREVGIMELSWLCKREGFKEEYVQEIARRLGFLGDVDDDIRRLTFSVKEPVSYFPYKLRLPADHPLAA